MTWASLLLGLGNTVAIAVLAVMAVKGHRSQRRHQAAQQEERVEIRHPQWSKEATKNELVVELVNTGHVPVYVRDVKLRSPKFDRAISYDYMGPDPMLMSSDPIPSGGCRFYFWSQLMVARFVERMDGTWVTVESNRGEIGRRAIEPAKL